MISTWADAVTAIGRSPELSILVKATFVLVVGLAAATLARRARASLRHLVLACTLAGALVLPVAATVASFAPIDIAIAGASIAGASTAGAAAASGANSTDAETAASASRRADGVGPSWTPSALLAALPLAWLSFLMRTIWAAGTLLLLGSLATALWRLMRIRRSGVPWLDVYPLVRTLAADADARAGARADAHANAHANARADVQADAHATANADADTGGWRHVDVLLHEGVAAPFTCGVAHPAIVLPADAPQWSDADVRRALVHELEHVRRGDWGLHLMARLTCAAYWFHPLAWMASRRLCLDAERACDDQVIRDAEETDYAEQLVSLATRLRGASAIRGPILAMANRSDLATRVSALLDAHQPRGRAGRLAATAAITSAIAVVLAIAPVRPVRASNDTLLRKIVSAQGNRADAGRQGRTPFDESLFAAATRGDVDGIAQLLDAGANADAAIGGDGSPLIGAASKGQVAAVRLLLDRGADPNMPVSGDGAPLIAAASKGHVEIVDLLLSRGANIDQIVDGDENALIQASANGQLPVVTLLITRGADVNASAWADARSGDGGEWRTPLSMARRGGHAAIVAALQKAGARD